MADAIEKREHKFPATLPSAAEQYAEIQRQIKQLQTREKALKEYLVSAIPVTLNAEEGVTKAFDVKEGIKHSAWYSPRPSYAKALAQMKDEGIIPKTRLERADEIVQENTTVSVNHKIEIADEYSEV